MNDFITLGEYLKSKREQLGYTTKEMEEKTKVRQRFLEALENGEYDKLPGEAYIKGFLKIYCEHLGINYQELIAGHSAFKQPESGGAAALPEGVSPSSARPIVHGNQQFGGEQQMQQFVPKNRMSDPIGKSLGNDRKVKQKRKKKIKFRFLLWVLVIALLAAGSYFAYDYYRQHNKVNDVEEQINQQLKEEDAAVPDEEPLPPADDSANSGEVVSPVAGDNGGTDEVSSPFKISFETSAERCWVEIYADDSLYYRGMIEAEDAKTVLAKDKISIKTNNAGGIKAHINGKDYGFLGGDGEVATKEYLASAYQ